ncbi:hypothetical protein [Flavobacterium poyangense]|uniref:hypothetical protein n=1 Tax=Flavobacterium poyangense TaxID=2204302 RepID=UPI00141E8FAB|nr:hypothetical protein [Flavobacterium sp. JXAS1]
MQQINQINSRENWYKETSKIAPYRGNLSEVSSVDCIIISAADLSYFYKLTGENTIAEYTVLIGLYNILLQHYFEDCNRVSANMVLDFNTISVCYEFESIAQKSIKEFLQEVREEVQTVYKCINYCEDDFVLTADANHVPFHFNYGAEETEEGLNYGLSFQIEKLRNKDYEILISHSPKFIDSAIVSHFLMNFKNWLKNLEENIDAPISKIPLLSDREREKLTDNLNAVNFCSETAVFFDDFIAERKLNKIPQDIDFIYRQSFFLF